MSRKNSRRSGASKAPATPHAPTAENPGATSELPAEVTTASGGKTQADRFNDWEEAKILAMLKNEIGSSGFVTMQRRHPALSGFQWSNLGAQIPLENFSVANVASTFGGGDYRAKARPSTGQFAKEFSFSIDHTIPAKNPMSGQEKKDSTPPVDVASVIRETREAVRAESAPVVEILKTQLAQRQDNTPMMDFFKFMLEQQQKAEERHAEALRKSEERTAKILERIAENRTPTASAPSLREQIQELTELGEALGWSRDSKGGSHETWKEKLVELGVQAMPLIAAKFAGGAPQLAGPIAPQLLPSSVTAPPASSTVAPVATAAPAMNDAISATPDQNSDAMNLQLQFAFRQFQTAAFQAAAKGKDAFEWVDSMFGMIPENFHSAVFNTARSEDWFARIFGTDPEAQRHLKFLTDVRDSILIRAFVSHSQRFSAAKAPALDTARKFLGWMPRDFDQTLFNLTDPETWKQTFSGIELDPKWLDQLREVIEKEFETETDPTPANTVEFPTAPATPANSAKSGAAAETKKR